MFGQKKEEPVSKVNDTDAIEREIFAAKDVKVASTTLTPHELYLLAKNGYEPVSVVYGNVVYSMGAKGFFRSVRGLFNRGEMVDFSRLNEDARKLALVRIHREADKIGATLVVGVHTDVRELADFLEVVTTGTAVRRVGPGDLAAEPVVGV